MAAFVTTIDLLWKGRKHRARASTRIAVEGVLFFRSGIGLMNDAIAFICTSREAQNLRGRRCISPRLVVQFFEASCDRFWSRQGSTTFDGCCPPTALFINQSLSRTATVEIRFHKLAAPRFGIFKPGRANLRELPPGLSNLVFVRDLIDGGSRHRRYPVEFSTCLASAVYRAAIRWPVL